MSNPTDTSVKIFTRFVEERYQDFRKKMSELTAVLGGENKEDKVVKAQAALIAAKSLVQSLSSADSSTMA